MENYIFATFFYCFAFYCAQLWIWGFDKSDTDKKVAISVIIMIVSCALACIGTVFLIKGGL